MKQLMQSLKIALSTYSRIPAGRTEWNEDNKKWALCFFPLVGAVIGLLLWLWWALCDRLGVGPLLRGAAACGVSLAVTGGIHLDGFCDTCDAMASWQPVERRLDILKDSHAGAFAIIKCCVYELLLCAALGEAKGRFAIVAALGFVLSRALSGLAAVTMKGARKEGFLQSFMDAADGKIVRRTLGATALLCAAGMTAASWAAGGAALLAAAACYVWYGRMSKKYFGGITGDLAGWFVCVCELAVALVAAMGGYVL